MKKYFLFSFILILTSSFAQNLKSTTVIGSTYNTDTRSWSQDTKAVQYTDERGFVLREEKFEYQDGQWVPTRLVRNEYDEAGWLVGREELVFVNGEWINESAYELQKTIDNAKKKELWRIWNGSVYIDSRQLLYSYENDLLITRIHQTYNDGTWENSLKEEMTYNDDGTESERLLSTWNGDWTESSKTSSTWDSNGNLLTETIEANIGGNWGSFQLIDRQYNDLNQLIYYESLFYDNTILSWIPNQNMEIEYNEMGKKMLATYSNYIASANPSTLGKTTGSWEPYWKDEYEYEESTDSETVPVITEYQLLNNYPNPFNPTTNISFSLKSRLEVKLSVCSITGETVTVITDGYFDAGTHSVKFDGSDFVSGVYFYKFESKNFVEVKKMVLIK